MVYILGKTLPVDIFPVEITCSLVLMGFWERNAGISKD